MPTIRPATAADLARVATTSTRAFADDPVMRWFFPVADEYEAAHPSLVRFLARRWLAAGTLWCTDDVAAMAGWLPPGRPEPPTIDEAEPGDDDEPGAADPVADHPAWRLARFGAIGTALAAHTPTEPHWYLNMLATHPDWQRQGLGGALMAVVFERSDAQGLPCYLETETVENVSYYRHHGFEVRSEWDLATDDSAGPHMWGMLRSAR